MKNRDLFFEVYNKTDEMFQVSFDTILVNDEEEEPLLCCGYAEPHIFGTCLRCNRAGSGNNIDSDTYNL